MDFPRSLWSRLAPRTGTGDCCQSATVRLNLVRRSGRSQCCPGFPRRSTSQEAIRRGEEMIYRRRWERTRKLPTIDPNENALRDRREPGDGQRPLAVGLLIFCLAFCALVFQAGWKEISAHERCGLNGASGCSPIALSGSGAQ